jgi:hypothetical protein
VASPVRSITYSASGAQRIDSTTLQSSTATVPITAEGVTTLSYFATDVAGTQEQAKTVTVRIDKTPPTASVTGVSAGATYILGNVPTPACTTSDALSGVLAQASIQLTGGTPNGVGTFTATCSGAQDNAGNTATPVRATCTVIYHFSGFVAPIKSPPMVNSGKARRTFPLKWQLTNASAGFTSALSAVTSITYKPTSCDSFNTDPGGALPTTSTGGTSLRYDSSQQYIYNWRTPSTPGCYTLFLTLDSGQVFPAYFNLS